MGSFYFQKTFFLDNFITIRTQFDARLKSKDKGSG